MRTEHLLFILTSCIKLANADWLKQHVTRDVPGDQFLSRLNEETI